LQAKAAKAFRAEGLAFEHLAIQNEPNQGGQWDPLKKSCGAETPSLRHLRIDLKQGS
jgi:hypothetical protein